MCYLVTVGTRETRVAVEHLCSGRFDSEEIRVGGRFTLSADRLADAGALTEDALVEIVSGAG